MKRWTDLSSRAVLVTSLAACSAPNTAPTPVLVAVTAPSASVSSIEPPPSVRARPTPSEHGWFTVPTPRVVTAVSLAGERCVAVGARKRWLVTPFKSTRSPTGSICDGDAKPLSDLPGDFFPVARYGRGVLYRGFGAEIATSETPEGDLKVVKVPFTMDSLSPMLAGTGILALGAKDKKLRLLDGETWKDVPLDGSDVESVAGTREGYGFAVTSSNRLYMTEDNGKTWKVHPTTGFSKLSSVGVATDPSVRQPTYGKLALWGIASAPVGDMKAGDRVGGVLLGSIPVDTFYPTLRFEPPRGVTDPAGVNLAKRAAARESLEDGRTCDAFDMFGDAAVASCTDDKGRFLVFTDDAGATVVEIDRSATATKPRVLRLGADQLLVAPSCPRGGAECADIIPFVLEKGADGAWSKVPLELPSGSRVDTAIDGRRGRGFYLVGARADLAADKKDRAPPLLEVARTGGASKRIVRRSLNGVDALPLFEKSIRAVRAVDVDDDGTLVLVVQLADWTLGYLRLSERLEPITLQPCTSKLLNRASSVAVRGKQVVGVLETGHVELSTDGCSSFASYQARDDATFVADSVTCGIEGCDFAMTADSWLWRWGENPIDTVIGRKLP